MAYEAAEPSGSEEDEVGWRSVLSVTREWALVFYALKWDIFSRERIRHTNHATTCHHAQAIQHITHNHAIHTTQQAHKTSHTEDAGGVCVSVEGCQEDVKAATLKFKLKLRSE
jgi:hypothetical protein